MGIRAAEEQCWTRRESSSGRGEFVGEPGATLGSRRRRFGGPGSRDIRVCEESMMEEREATERQKSQDIDDRA